METHAQQRVGGLGRLGYGLGKARDADARENGPRPRVSQDCEKVAGDSLPVVVWGRRSGVTSTHQRNSPKSPPARGVDSVDLTRPPEL